MSIAYSGCMSVALGIQLAKRMRRFIFSTVACSATDDNTIDAGKPRKTSAEAAGRRTFRVLTSSQQSGNYSVYLCSHISCLVIFFFTAKCLYCSTSWVSLICFVTLDLPDGGHREHLVV
jgi:hypothetical protein